jgi:CO/xanthine dehydrogenase FAD-binding subunit
MKPAAFDYARPKSLEEACAMLAEGDDVRIIAGGQTLVPLMAMRLARPRLLIDIARIPDLAYIRREGDFVVIGATTKQCLLEQDSLVRADLPLLSKVVPFIGHAPTRARGTVGGSLANADPAAEIALIAVTLGATLTYRDGNATADVPASEFFVGPMMTALPATACLTAVRFPVWPEPRIGVGFHEISARQSDFAFASAAAQVALDENGLCRRVALGIGAVTMVPLRLDGVGQALEGTRAEAAVVRRAVTEALDGIEPMVDLHATAAYRRRVAVTLAVRAVTDALKSAASGAAHAR